MKVRVSKYCRHYADEVGDVIGYDNGFVRVAFTFRVDGHLDVWHYIPADLTPVEEAPTDEQIDRFLALYNEYCHVPSAALKLYPTAKDYIKAKWNEDKAKID